MNLLFEDKFEMELVPGWAWTHEEPGAWRIGSGVLHLRTLPGTLWGEANNAHNFLLRRVGKFQKAFATRLSVNNEPQLMGEQAGLIWYYDDDNYIKLVKESLEGVEWIVLAREEDGQPELIERVRISALSAELQLVLIDAQIHGQFRLSPETDWQEVGACSLVGDAHPRVGLFTHGGPDEVERWVEFREFVVLEP